MTFALAAMSFTLALGLIASAPIAIAKDAPLLAADPVLEARMLHIAAELRCLVCQNQTLADSDADLALDLREQMRVMLRSGADDAQVRAFMTDRYGDFVLYRPPVKASTLALWFGPAVLLVGGLAALALVLRRRSRLSEDQFEAEPFDVDDVDDADRATQGKAAPNSAPASASASTPAPAHTTAPSLPATEMGVSP